jgi:hypothetical protein
VLTQVNQKKKALVHKACTHARIHMHARKHAHMAASEGPTVRFVTKQQQQQQQQQHFLSIMEHRDLIQNQKEETVW